MGCFVVAEFLLTSASRGPSAIAEPLVVYSYYRPTVSLSTVDCSEKAKYSRSAAIIGRGFAHLQLQVAAI